MEETISKLIDVGGDFGLKLVAAIAIYIIGKWVVGLVTKLVIKMMQKANVDEALTKFVSSIVRTVLLIFVILAAVGKLGVQTTSFIAILGAAGLAVGMALQGTLGNFAAGVMIILFRPFKIGDFIDAGGVMGSVKEITIFNTIMSTPDNRKIICPNGQITSGTITNFSDTDTRRVDLVFGVSYDDDLSVAKRVLQDLCAADERILKDPETVIAVAELGDSCVNIVCRPWVEPANYWGVHFDITEKAKVELEKAGCSIPYPQRDVHVIQQAQEALQNS